MSRIILNEYTITPQTPTTDTLAIYASGGELHVLNDQGTDITLKSAQLPRCSIVLIPIGSILAGVSAWTVQGESISFVARTDRYFITTSNGFATNNNTVSYLGVRINGVDTTFATYVAGQATHAMILTAVLGTTYTINQIIRNPIASTSFAPVGGFLSVMEVGATL